MNQIRPNAERARLAVNLFIVQFVVLVATVATDVYQYRVIQSYESGNAGYDELTRADTVVSISGLLYLVALIASVITFLQWFRRAYWNLHALFPMQPQWGEGWAAGAWFVPFLNLWRPFQIMKEVWSGTHRAAPRYSARANDMTLLGIWWAMWVISQIVTNIGSRIRIRASTLSDFLVAIPIDIAGSVLSCVGLVLIIQIIRRLAVAEEEAYQATTAPGNSIFSPNLVASDYPLPDETPPNIQQ